MTIAVAARPRRGSRRRGGRGVRARRRPDADARRARRRPARPAARRRRRARRQRARRPGAAGRARPPGRCCCAPPSRGPPPSSPTPAAPSAVLFTAGLALGAATPAAIALALVPDRRAGAALALASAGLLGVLSALVFDPRGDRLHELPAQPAAGRAGARGCSTRSSARASGWGSRDLAGWLRHPARPRAAASPRSRAVPARASRSQYAHSLPRGYLAADPTDRALWTLQGLALLAVAATVAWEPVRERRARARLARLVVELEARPGPRGLRDVLGEVLGDPALQIAYPLADGRRPRRRRPPRRARRRPGGDRAARRRAVPLGPGCSPIPSRRRDRGVRAGWRCAASACRPSCAPGWRTCARSAAASSPPETPSAGRSSATSTTAPSSASPRSRSRSRRRAGGRTATRAVALAEAQCGGAGRARRAARRRARARPAGARRRGTRRRGRGVRGDRRRRGLVAAPLTGRALRARGRGDRLPRGHRGGAARAGDATVRAAREDGRLLRRPSTPPCRRGRS